MARYAAREEEIRLLKEIYDQDQKELVEELNVLDCNVESVWDFVNRKYDYPQAIPILIKHLNIKHHPRISAGIVRSLAVPVLKNNDELWQILVGLYQKTPSDKLIDVACERGLQQAVALALANNATKERIPNLKMLIAKCPDGDALSWLEKAIVKLEKPSPRRKKKIWPPPVSAVPGEWLSKDEIADCLRPEVMTQENIAEYSIEFDLCLLKEVLMELDHKVPGLHWPNIKAVKSAFSNLAREEIGGISLKRTAEINNNGDIRLLIWHIDFDAVRLTFLSPDKGIITAIETICDSFIDLKDA